MTACHPTVQGANARRRAWLRCGRALVACAALATAGVPAVAAAPSEDRPGQGVAVLPLKSPLAEEGFQTLIVMKALQQLGYDVQPWEEVEYAAAHMAIAQGDATFMAVHWNPMHADIYRNLGGDRKLFRKGVYSGQAAHGYLIDRKTAQAHGITHLSQLKDPAVARLFDADGDGKADLTGCNPGWHCATVIDHHIQAYGLGGTVTHWQGSYPALIADTIARLKMGRPVLYYTWVPYWTSSVLRPGREVIWLQVPFSSLPGKQAGTDTRQANGRNYGFTVNQQQIVANKAFTDRHPDAARLFEVMQLPAADISAQNLLMTQGQDQPADVARHADSWIKAHQKTFDGWLAQARAAARRAKAAPRPGPD